MFLLMTVKIQPCCNDTVIGMKPSIFKHSRLNTSMSFELKLTVCPLQSR